MGSSLILVGLGMAAVGLAGRVASRHAPKAFANMEQAMKNVQNLDSGAWANSKYHKGGFETKMTKREVYPKPFIGDHLPAISHMNTYIVHRILFSSGSFDSRS